MHTVHINCEEVRKRLLRSIKFQFVQEKLEYLEDIRQEVSSREGRESTGENPDDASMNALSLQVSS